MFAYVMTKLRQGRKTIKVNWHDDGDIQDTLEWYHGGKIRFKIIVGDAMTYVSFDPDELMEVCRDASERKAELLARFSAQEGKPMSVDIDESIEQNLMSGKLFTEKIGTPNYCSPSSESYWSM